MSGFDVPDGYTAVRAGGPSQSGTRAPPASTGGPSGRTWTTWTPRRSASRGVHLSVWALRVNRNQVLGGSNEHDHDEGWSDDLLQGLGPEERATHRFPSRLAIERR